MNYGFKRSAAWYERDQMNTTFTQATAPSLCVSASSFADSFSLESLILALVRVLIIVG